MTLVLIFIVGGILATSVQVSVLLVVGNQLAGFLCSHVSICWLLHGKSTLNAADSILWHCLWELNLEDNVQVTKVVRLLVEWKTLILDGLDIVWLDNLTWFVLNSNL